MRQPMIVAALIGGLACAALPAGAQTAQPATSGQEAASDTSLTAIVAGSHRSEADRARDRYRHPVETLSFFGIRPDMTVVEISPGGGWYTEILAPFLREKGQYIVALSAPGQSERAKAGWDRFQTRFGSNPALYGKPRLVAFGSGVEAGLVPDNSVDMVLTFRNVHNWTGSGFAPQAFRTFFAALKPGGILGVVDHRLPEDRAQDAASAKSGYIRQSEVVRLATEAGFRLVDASEVNANPKDMANHPAGVWTLPPTLRLGDTDRQKYLEIGESDRMTLKFVKPQG